MSRRNFSKAVKAAVIKRATQGGAVFCEGCGALAKRFEIDHVRADGLGGEPTLENAKLLCKACHAPKTANDVAVIAKAKRREARSLGIRKPPTLRSRGFDHAEKPAKNGAVRIDRSALPKLGPRELYR